ncbi:MAG: hypothetical protein IT280_12755 [Ignavibacteria bacterium]|nr:hypothetical protein [Ignavibacteria bacterium]
MDLKTTREAVVTSGVLTEEDQKHIQEFIQRYAAKLKIDFRKDVSFSIRTKHNEDGANLLIKYKDVETRDIDVSQMNLFSSNGAGTKKSKAGDDEKKGVDTTGNIVDM